MATSHFAATPQSDIFSVSWPKKIGTTENARFHAFITLRSQFHLHHCSQWTLTEIVSKITPKLGLSFKNHSLYHITNFCTYFKGYLHNIILNSPNRNHWERKTATIIYCWQQQQHVHSRTAQLSNNSRGLHLCTWPRFGGIGSDWTDLWEQLCSVITIHFYLSILLEENKTKL